jgi:methionine sulfoxide reductase heme-binding subunit
MSAVIHVTENIWWYFARAGGLVAWGLLAASVFWGLIFSGRLTRKRPTPAWNLDLHRFLGGLALIFVVIHVAALMADPYAHFGLSKILVPFASHWRPGAVAWGIVAFYLVLAVEATSLAMRWLPRKMWRSVHLLSFVLFVLSTVHAIQSGTDISNPLVRGIGIVLLVTATITLVLRIMDAQRKAAARARRAIVTAEPAPAAPVPAVSLAETLDWTVIEPTPSPTVVPFGPVQASDHDTYRRRTNTVDTARVGKAPTWSIANPPLARASRPVVMAPDQRQLVAVGNGRGLPSPTWPHPPGAEDRTAVPFRGTVAGTLLTGNRDAGPPPRQREGPKPVPPRRAEQAPLWGQWPPPIRPPKVARFAEPARSVVKAS